MRPASPVAGRIKGRFGAFFYCKKITDILLQHQAALIRDMNTSLSNALLLCWNNFIKAFLIAVALGLLAGATLATLGFS